MTIEKIVDTVAQFYNLEPREIVGHRRTKDLADARQIVCFLARQEIKKTYPTIAKKLGNRDHTTVLYSCKKIAEKIKQDQTLKNQIDQILLSLKSGIVSQVKITGIVERNIEDKKESKNYGENKNYLEHEFKKMLNRQSSNQDSTRQIDILQKYQTGFTFEEIGDVHNLTRERIRQIVLRGLLLEACKIFKNGVDLEINEFIDRKKSEHSEKMKEKHGIIKKVALESATEKEKKWSRYYDCCRKCGTRTIKHVSNGYCKWCYPKSDIFKKLQESSRLRNIEKRRKYTKEYYKSYINRPEVITRLKRQADLKFHGGNRQNALARDNYKCSICGISQKESTKKYHRDLYVDHINGTPNNLDNLITRCFSCHNSEMIKMMRQKVERIKVVKN